MRSFVKVSAATCAAALAIFSGSVARADFFTQGDLIVTRSVYQGTDSTVTIGQTLPGCSLGGCTPADAGASSNGLFPACPTNTTPCATPPAGANVFNNALIDPSFGVTSPIFVDDIHVSAGVATTVQTLAIPTNLAVTSFSSKSEMAINPSTANHFATFMGYVSPINTLDVSNSNTPNHVDATNPVMGTNYPRAVIQIDSHGGVQVTPVDAYSGNNGRAAIFDEVNNQYLLVGNAGNGGSPEPVNIVDNTGVQTVPPNGGPESTVVGAQQGDAGTANGFQFGFSVTSLGDPADKSGKDDNFRGMAIFQNTLYVTKGSGSNGVDTVYQVGTAGTLPTAATASTTAITILPGFPTTLAKTATRFPFGIWFANATTLYVADEGDGKAADAATSTTAGLGKWVLQSGTWTNVYTLQAGLNLGTQYNVAGLPTSLNPATDGLRSLTGIVNGDGTVTLYAVTSTISASGDQGADSNQLVTISDNPSFTTAAQASAEVFTTLATAPLGQVFRGVSLSPVTPPVAHVPAAPPVALWLLALTMLGVGAVFVARRQSGSSTASA